MQEFVFRLVWFIKLLSLWCCNELFLNGWGLHVPYDALQCARPSKWRIFSYFLFFYSVGLAFDKFTDAISFWHGLYENYSMNCMVFRLVDMTFVKFPIGFNLCKNFLRSTGLNFVNFLSSDWFFKIDRTIENCNCIGNCMPIFKWTLSIKSSFIWMTYKGFVFHRKK